MASRQDEHQTISAQEEDSRQWALQDSDSGPRNIFWSVCSFILVTELCERLAYYGLVGSLSIFITRELQLSSVKAGELPNTFHAMTYFTPLFGAFIAERYWGRYRTIVASCSIYCVGLLLCTAAAHPHVRSPTLFFLGLFGFIALGAGGIKPNVVVLGADQLLVEC